MQTTLSVSLKGAPTNANESSLPNGVSILDLALANNAPVQTGLMVRDVASPSAFVPLEGPGVTVAEVTFLCLRASTQVEIEMTQQGEAAKSVWIKRCMILEFDAAKPLILLRVKGVALLEYFASGTQ